jgi:transcriptional regulator with XRE-family HTH domain
MGVATIGSELLERRRELGLDQLHAAKIIGVSRTTFSSYERDLQRPSVEVFPALASFLDVGIEEFLLLYGASSIASVRPGLDRLLSAEQTSADSTEGDAPTSDDAPLDTMPTTEAEEFDPTPLDDRPLASTSTIMSAERGATASNYTAPDMVSMESKTYFGSLVDTPERAKRSKKKKKKKSKK